MDNWTCVKYNIQKESFIAVFISGTNIKMTNTVIWFFLHLM